MEVKDRSELAQILNVQKCLMSQMPGLLSALLSVFGKVSNCLWKK